MNILEAINTAQSVYWAAGVVISFVVFVGAKTIYDKDSEVVGLKAQNEALLKDKIRLKNEVDGLNREINAVSFEDAHRRARTKAYDGGEEQALEEFEMFTAANTARIAEFYVEAADLNMSNGIRKGEIQRIEKSLYLSNIAKAIDQTNEDALSLSVAGGIFIELMSSDADADIGEDPFHWPLTPTNEDDAATTVAELISRSDDERTKGNLARVYALAISAFVIASAYLNQHHPNRVVATAIYAGYLKLFGFRKKSDHLAKQAFQAADVLSPSNPARIKAGTALLGVYEFRQEWSKLIKLADELLSGCTAGGLEKTGMWVEINAHKGEAILGSYGDNERSAAIGKEMSEICKADEGLIGRGYFGLANGLHMRALIESKKFQEARLAGIEAVEVIEKTIPWVNRDLICARYFLWQCLVQLGAGEEAAAVLERAAPESEQICPPQDWLRKELVSALSDRSASQGWSSECEATDTQKDQS